MRTVRFLIFWASLSSAAFAQERVTVTQLEQTVATIQGLPDGQAAQRLSELELTERLSETRFTHLEAALAGPATRKRLAILADVSAFHDLPESELPPTPSPDRATQTRLLSLARDYVVNTLLKLPNFFATRETGSFVSTPANSRVNSINTIKFVAYEEIDHSNVTVLYRDQHELIAKGRRFAGSAKGLRTVGEFGPILITVLNDCAKGGIVVWGRWEQGSTGVQAVFRYHVPQQSSHYSVSFPGLAPESQHYPGYHGELALSPIDGSILRLTVVADLDPNEAMSSAGLFVVYGPIEIGGRLYICPVKSAALATVRTIIQAMNDAAPTDGHAAMGVLSKSLGDTKNYLNEVQFTDYHNFRSESRILAEDRLPEAKPPAPLPPNAPSGIATVEDLRPEADGLNRLHGARYSVAEFRVLLSNLKTDHISDKEVVRSLSNVQLTERLTSAALERLEAEYSNSIIRPTLIAVADASALLAPPSPDTPMTPAPDAAGQASLLAKAMNLSHESASDMPNLTAIRETMSFEDTPATKKTPYQPPQRVGSSSVSVVFRNGHENIKDTKGHKAKSKDSEMSVPEFGFMLSTVVADAAEGEIDWDHWEHSAQGDEAVFSYQVSEEQSHFLHFASPAVLTGTTPSPVSTQNIGHNPGYHGEIWLNPMDGTILRLTVIGELNSQEPVTHANYVVEYGSLKINGASPIIPMKGVAIEMRTDGSTTGTGSDNEHKGGELVTVQKEHLTDVTYKKYHEIEAAEGH